MRSKYSVRGIESSEIICAEASKAVNNLGYTDIEERDSSVNGPETKRGLRNEPRVI